MEMTSDPEVEGLEEALLAFMAAYRRSRSSLHRDPGLVGLTNAQFAVLEAVQAQGVDGVGSVAAAARLAQPPTTRAIGRLEAKGLVERRPTTGDQRVSALEVTAAGTELLAHHRRRLREAAIRLHRTLSESARADAAALLAVLGEVFDELP